jgi:hypothetical protein
LIHPDLPRVLTQCRDIRILELGMVAPAVLAAHELGLSGCGLPCVLGQCCKIGIAELMMGVPGFIETDESRLLSIDGPNEVGQCEKFGVVINLMIAIRLGDLGGEGCSVNRKMLCEFFGAGRRSETVQGQTNQPRRKN